MRPVYLGADTLAFRYGALELEIVDAVTGKRLVSEERVSESPARVGLRPRPTMSDRSRNGGDLNRQSTEEDLIRLQATTLLYYLHESNPANGLIRDKTNPSASWT